MDTHRTCDSHIVKPQSHTPSKDEEKKAVEEEAELKKIDPELERILSDLSLHLVRGWTAAQNTDASRPFLPPPSPRPPWLSASLGC